MFGKPVGHGSGLLKFVRKAAAILPAAVFLSILIASHGSVLAQAGELAFTFANYTVTENTPSGLAVIQVARTEGNSGAVSVQYATSDGTAHAPGDYTATSGTLTWAANDVNPKNIYVTIVADFLSENNETVNLTLSNPTGGATLGSPSTAVLTIFQPAAPPDVTIDGLLDDAYTSEYARYQLFNYGPTPNMASGSLHAFASGEYLYIYYAQNPLAKNDNSYGETGKQTPIWMKNWHISWGTTTEHLFKDLIKSDKTEFIFYDRSGNVRLDFFADYAEEGKNPPYTVSTGGLDGDAGEILINNVDCPGCTDQASRDAWLRANVEIKSSLDWNINHHDRIYFDCQGHQLDTHVTSPPLSYMENGQAYYGYRTQACTNLEDYADWIYDYAIELRIPLSAFPNEPIIEIVARAHNSPAKQGTEDNPSDPAQSSIGDYVWLDWNNNGLQDWFELGIPNVAVELYWDKDSDGRFTEDELMATTRTDGNGYYLFKGLFGGSYTIPNTGITAYSGAYKVNVVEETLPYGMDETNLTTKRLDSEGEPLTPNEPNEPHILHNADRYAEGHVDRDILGVKEDYRQADFGYRPTGAIIGDYVWSDADDDGIQDSGEAGIANVTVNLDRRVGGQWVLNFMTTETDQTGHYLFFGDENVLPDGYYRVNVDETDPQLSGYSWLTVGEESKTDPTATIHVARVNGFFFDTVEDFGYYSPLSGKVGDTVFYDINWNGFQDEGEPGIQNVSVNLYHDLNGNGLKDSADQFIGSTVTNEDGNYWFSGLPVSDLGETYFAVVTDSHGALTSYQPFYAGTYMSGLITTAARENLTLDFPYVRIGVIGDRVWNDALRGGAEGGTANVQDSGEPGIPGVTIVLDYWNPDLTTADKWEYAYRTTTTDSAGYYYFTGLRTTQPGGTASQYRVRVSVP
ncbi:MAG: hypothetical protein EHM18_05050, partial [Acidobacteria bacterium]